MQLSTVSLLQSYRFPSVFFFIRLNLFEIKNNCREEPTHKSRGKNDKIFGDNKKIRKTKKNLRDDHFLYFSLR